jgi:hypothetical protein
MWVRANQVGRLAARLLLFHGGPRAREWADGFDPEAFKAVFAQTEDAQGK